MASGIRSVFCYSPSMRIKSWDPDLTLDGGMLDDWVLEHFENLGAAAPFGKGRVQLGLAFDGLSLPKDLVTALYDRARKLGVRVITSHYVRTFFGEYA